MNEARMGQELIFSNSPFNISGWGGTRLAAFVLTNFSMSSNRSGEGEIRKSLIERLRNICANLAPKDFEVLVLKMTREQLRSEGVRWKRNVPDPC